MRRPCHLHPLREEVDSTVVQAKREMRAIVGGVEAPWLSVSSHTPSPFVLHRTPMILTHIPRRDYAHM